MKRKLVSLLVIISVFAVSCKSINTVVQDYYVVDIDGYQLVFRDVNERISNALRSNGKLGVDHVILVKESKKKKEIWRVATKAEEAALATEIGRVDELADANVIKVPLNMIEVYTRSIH